MNREFSVYWWDNNDKYYAELKFVSAEQAVEKAKSLSDRPAAKVGIIKRIIITDGLDCIVFEWVKGKVVFPPRTH